MTTSKKHPCIYCRHAMWDKIASCQGIDRPIFQSCIAGGSVPTGVEKCEKEVRFTVSVQRIIDESFERCGGDGWS
jgi:hypothetical protein